MILKNSMKPVIVFSISNFVRGGAQRQMVRLIPYLIDEYEVHLFVLYKYPDLETILDELPQSVCVHQFEFKNFFSFKQWFKFRKSLAKINPNLLITSFFFSNVVSRVTGFISGVPVIAREHNTSSGLRPIHRLVDRILAKRDIAIVAVSKEVADSVSKLVGIPRNKFVVINNGIDLNEIDEQKDVCDSLILKKNLSINPGEKVMIAVGRLVEQKRLDLLLDGFALFSKTHPDWKLVVVGGGGMQDLLEQQVQDLGIKNKVTFVGEIVNVHCYYCIADCLVSTSEKEGLSNAHLEALAHGVPILTTPTGGTSAVVKEGETGLIIKHGTAVCICETLDRFTKMNVSSMKIASIKHRNKFAIEETAKQYKNLFSTSIKN